MDSQKVLDQYLENSVRTASPEQLTLMLFNGCIKNIRLSMKNINEHDIENANRTIIKAQRIVCELRDTLNFDFDTSRHLYALYDFVMDTLIKANIKKDGQKLEIACGIMTELRDAWYQAMGKEKPSGMMAN